MNVDPKRAMGLFLQAPEAPVRSVKEDVCITETFYICPALDVELPRRLTSATCNTLIKLPLRRNQTLENTTAAKIDGKSRVASFVCDFGRHLVNVWQYCCLSVTEKHCSSMTRCRLKTSFEINLGSC